MSGLVNGGPPEVLATVDGGGNLPFRSITGVMGWHRCSPDAGRAGRDPARRLGRRARPVGGRSGTILQVLAAAEPERYVRSFVRRPSAAAPALDRYRRALRHLDAVESVLRFARNDGQGGPNLFDTGRLYGSGADGPLVIDNYNVERRQPLLLVACGLEARSSATCATRAARPPESRR